MKTEFSGILFDLDGTLLDTALDFVPAVNEVRLQMGLFPLELTDIRPHVSHGAKRLVKECLLVSEQQSKFESVLNALLDAYERSLASHARLFEGMDRLLERCEYWGLPWGVVTNKPKRFTEPLLNALGLDTKAQCIVSGDTLLQKKPDPAPLAFACHQMQIEPGKTLYVGDAERDIQAGKSAGMPTAVALFGYLSSNDQPSLWKADYELHKAEDLFSILDPVQDKKSETI